MAPFLRLGVNVDHVATIRNARGGRHPDPVEAAEVAIAAGADGITAHLREDRRHIVDDDIARLMARIKKPLNLEMAATPEMVEIARRVRPHAACIVPERRQERTTEGGLDVVRQRAALRPVVSQMNESGIRVSLFIAADPAQIEAAAAIGTPVIEIHTGAWCDAVVAHDTAVASVEFKRIVEGATLRARPWPRSACRPRPRLRHRRADCGAAGNRRAQHRSFPDRRRGVRWPRRCDCQDARRHGPRQGPDRDQAMILGIGSDITDVQRIAKVIERHGERFLDRIFTATERSKAERRRNRVETYAKRFAAKEACAKALGTGIRSGVWWRDMGVVNLPSGRPTMQLAGGALRRLKAITPPGYEARIDLTITDEGPMAQAFVVISAEPMPAT